MFLTFRVVQGRLDADAPWRHSNGSRAKQAIAIVFVIQTILTLYTCTCGRRPKRIEALLTQSQSGVQLRFVFFGMPNNDCADWWSFRGFPNLRQALFQGASESALTAKSIFASIRKRLECTPQRRCGGMVDATDLKSVLAKAGYGFESHHRHRRKWDFTRENRSELQSSRLRMVAPRNARKHRIFVNYSSSSSPIPAEQLPLD